MSNFGAGERRLPIAAGAAADCADAREADSEGFADAARSNSCVGASSVAFAAADCTYQRRAADFGRGRHIAAASSSLEVR